jgi:hypothetical protein
VVFLYLSGTLSALQVVLGTNYGRGLASLDSASIISLLVLDIVFVATTSVLGVANMIYNTYTWYISRHSLSNSNIITHSTLEF